MENYKDLNDYEIIYMIRENSEDATEILLKKYKPIIISLAKYYYRIGKKYGLELDDFIQEGNYALFYASKKYIDNKNSIFYTYSILCIRSRMQNLIIKSNTNKNNVLNYSISLNTVINEENELIDYLEDNTILLPELAVETKEQEDIIKGFLFNLSLEYANIFELKLNGFANRDIESLLGRSQTNIRKALSIIKKNLKLYIEK